jgi:hypothetical protein
MQYNIHFTSFIKHLLVVTKERSLYKKALDTAKESVHQYYSSGEFSPPPLAEKTTPCSRDVKVHYSFDMALQVFYPNDPLQPHPKEMRHLRSVLRSHTTPSQLPH